MNFNAPQTHGKAWHPAFIAAAVILIATCYWYSQATEDTRSDHAPSAQDPSPLSGGLLAQPLQTVDLPIQNLNQETNVWCWATVAQQIILATRGPQNTPSQCELVSAATGAAPGDCCHGYNQRCLVTGTLSQIAQLIAQYGGRTSMITPPADPMTLYRTLAQGHAVIIAIREGDSGHVVVARGMMTVPVAGGYRPMVILNDPMAQYTQPVSFDAIAPIWREALVVN